MFSKLKNIFIGRPLKSSNEGEDGTSVDLVEGKEAQGPTRILKTAIDAFPVVT